MLGCLSCVLIYKIDLKYNMINGIHSDIKGITSR
jgi:hypothetical protein